MNLDISVPRAIAFLEGARNAEGWWQDFKLAPGCSDEWVTAYVGTALASLSTRPTMITALKAWRLLASRRQSASGWGYNALTPTDADSTLWALQLAGATGCRGWKAAQKGQAFLTQHVRAGGGVATYANDRLIRRFIGASVEQSFQGWCAPHTCVTAAAASLPEFRCSACDWLRQQQREDGSWGSYWWCEDEYATALAAEAVARGIEPGDRDRIQQAIYWARERIGRDGSVVSVVQASGSPFATAWVARILILSDQPQEVGNSLEQVVRWLLQHQNADGSWSPSAGLRVPPPEVAEPENYHHWVLHGSIEGAISLDQNGIFTTATVLQALGMIKRAYFNQVWGSCSIPD